MSLQLVGLNCCSSCSAEDLVWTCPVCETSVHGQLMGNSGEIVNFSALRCGSCGADREVVTYVVPESLTDFWVHEVRSAERISKVDFSEAMGRPTALYLRRGVINVEEMFYFVRVADGTDGLPVFGPTPHGAYFLRTELGLCVVVSVPHELGEGEFSPAISDWHLVETDNSMRQQLEGPRASLPGRSINPTLSSEDEGLLRNSFAYRIVYRIENGLRILLSERLKKKAQGSNRWWKAVAPNRLRESVNEVNERRRDSAWFELQETEPMLLTTLGELRDLLEADWENLGIGLGPKEVTLGSLRKLEFYRNELAHCRPLTLRMLSDLNDVERSLERITKINVSRTPDFG